MRTPVIIPTYNGEKTLEKTLSGLPGTVDPFVVDNGSDDPSATQRIAQSHQVGFLAIEKRGKTRAIQAAFEKLGELALEPLIILDNDTVPVLPRSWHRILLGALTQDNPGPVVASAPVLFEKNRNGPVEPILRSVYRLGETAISRRRALFGEIDGHQHGPNFGLYLKGMNALERIKELPNIWPGEDRAITRAVLMSDPHAKFIQSLNMLALARTPESSTMPHALWMLFHLEEAMKLINAEYVRTGPPDAISYHEWAKSRVSREE
jgi:glycosyltransferase involved in cell wall biosynthesis